MIENSYQSKLIKKIQEEFPGAIILKNDANYLQGFPDLTVLFECYWATLETKKARDSKKQKNQAYYQRLLNRMSYSAFAYPENERNVFNGLQQTFRS